MTTYDFTIIGGTVCGIIMVLGGIVLLYKGAIKLEVASKDPSLTVEMFERKLKLTTHAPALGLFVIGLLFVFLAIYFAQTTTAKPIPVRGKAENIEEEISVIAKSEWHVAAHQGHVQDVIRPQLDVLWVVISAPGYNEHILCYNKEDFIKGVNLGKVQLVKAMEKLDPNENNIEAFPPGFKDTPLDAEKTFGIGVRP
jgi:hypothetical protein